MFIFVLNMLCTNQQEGGIRTDQKRVRIVQVWVRKIHGYETTGIRLQYEAPSEPPLPHRVYWEYPPGVHTFLGWRYKKCRDFIEKLGYNGKVWEDCH